MRMHIYQSNHNFVGH